MLIYASHPPSVPQAPSFGSASSYGRSAAPEIPQLRLQLQGGRAAAAARVWRSSGSNEYDFARWVADVLPHLGAIEIAKTLKTHFPTSPPKRVAPLPHDGLIAVGAGMVKYWCDVPVPCI